MRREKKISEEQGKGNNISSSCSLADWQNTLLYPDWRKEFFQAGRFYWEVDIRDSGAWDLGICRHNVMRQGRICVKPEDGFWAIRFYKDEYWALTSPEMQLTLKEHPTRVCIFLEYEDGRISFYNMTDESHMHTFSQGSFNGSHLKHNPYCGPSPVFGASQDLQCGLKHEDVT
ncbi:hypothetical protein PANDA_018213 [Ailuropoda melanoleuca]|uniref:B30.2/SPRY domain-containing protein n=1 Tax=Ailuropoda melanoleuca TaxID=9646 RepID=D2HZH1_AILME|nr:hypothetical protein PANDA_018213 [Ailuropoda melanoleuca]